MGRRLDTAREVAADLRALAREAFTRPEPEVIPYIRCDACGRVGPHTVTQRTWSAAAEERAGRRGLRGIAAPPETVCPLCRHAQPRTVGDELPGVVEIACPYRWGWQLGWRRCGDALPGPGRRGAGDLSRMRNTIDLRAVDGSAADLKRERPPRTSPGARRVPVVRRCCYSA